MKTFEKATLKDLRVSIDKALEQVEKQYNLKISAGNCSYTEDSCTFKLNCSLPNALSKSAKDLIDHLEYRNECSHLLSLDKDKVGKDRTSEYKLTGYRVRARKNPFLIEDISNGKEFICTSNYAERLFGDNSLGTQQHDISVTQWKGS